MDPKFQANDIELFKNVTQYKSLKSKFIYLTITRSNKAFVVEIVNQLQKPKITHWKVTLRILTYGKNSPRRGLLHMKHGYFRIQACSNSRYEEIKWTKNSYQNTVCI